MHGDLYGVNSISFMLQRQAKDPRNTTVNKGSINQQVSQHGDFPHKNPNMVRPEDWTRIFEPGQGLNDCESGTVAI